MSSSTALERSPYPLLPDTFEPAPLQRPRLLFIGTALASAGVIMGFAGLMSLYIGARRDHLTAPGDNTWLPQGVEIPLTQPNMMAFTLVFSAVAMYWALYSIKNNDRTNTSIALAMSAFLGLAFIAQSAFLLDIMNMPAGGEDLGRPSLFYAAIGYQLAVMIAAIVFTAVMWLRSIGGDFSAKDVEGIRSAALFWYVGVGLYLVLWYAIYITK